jgi:hypothetical protein
VNTVATNATNAGGYAELGMRHALIFVTDMLSSPHLSTSKQTYTISSALVKRLLLTSHS